jgi:predicted RNA-binding protein YlxR (DUF448 family)
VAAITELVRVSLDPVAGNLVIGRSQPGRGAWLCAHSPPCLEEALRRRAFDRALRTTCSPAQLADLASLLPTTT